MKVPLALIIIFSFLKPLFWFKYNVFGLARVEKNESVILMKEIYPKYVRICIRVYSLRIYGMSRCPYKAYSNENYLHTRELINYSSLSTSNVMYIVYVDVDVDVDLDVQAVVSTRQYTRFCDDYLNRVFDVSVASQP